MIYKVKLYTNINNKDIMTNTHESDLDKGKENPIFLFKNCWKMKCRLSQSPELSVADSATKNGKKEKHFKCSLCSKDYSSKSRMNIHFRTHFGIKPFECTHCGKKFNEKGNLNCHLRIHSGEKPYKCTYNGCIKQFRVFGNLSDHLKRHYNIRPFVCNVCEACFGRKSVLKKHMRTHTGEKPYECSFCHQRFSEKGNLKKHIKTHFKVEKLRDKNANKFVESKGKKMLEVFEHSWGKSLMMISKSSSLFIPGNRDSQLNESEPEIIEKSTLPILVHAPYKKENFPGDFSSNFFESNYFISEILAEDPYLAFNDNKIANELLLFDS